MTMTNPQRCRRRQHRATVNDLSSSSMTSSSSSSPSPFAIAALMDMESGLHLSKLQQQKQQQSRQHHRKGSMDCDDDATATTCTTSSTMTSSSSSSLSSSLSSSTGSLITLPSTFSSFLSPSSRSSTLSSIDERSSSKQQRQLLIKQQKPLKGILKTSKRTSSSLNYCHDLDDPIASTHSSTTSSCSGTSFAGSCMSSDGDSDDDETTNPEGAQQDHDLTTDTCRRPTTTSTRKQPIQQPKRTVRFFSKVKVRRVSSHRKYTAKERCAQWYNEEENTLIKEDACSVVRLMMKIYKEHKKKQRQQDKPSPLNAHLNGLMFEQDEGNDNGDISTRNGGDNGSDNDDESIFSLWRELLEDDELGCTVRGLEFKLPSFNRHRQEKKVSIVWSVLEVQEERRCQKQVQAQQQEQQQQEEEIQRQHDNDSSGDSDGRLSRGRSRKRNTTNSSRSQGRRRTETAAAAVTSRATSATIATDSDPTSSPRSNIFSDGDCSNDDSASSSSSDDDSAENNHNMGTTTKNSHDMDDDLDLLLSDVYVACNWKCRVEAYRRGMQDHNDAIQCWMSYE